MCLPVECWQAANSIGQGQQHKMPDPHMMADEDLGEQQGRLPHVRIVGTTGTAVDPSHRILALPITYL